jgi:outer membrane protein OmpA-like peptidoglycan-associated protein/tetratricopeptide (TPR) repeat protein
MKNLLFIILILSAVNLVAQNKSRVKAQQAFTHKKYAETIAIIQKIPRYELSISDRKMMAESYHQVHDYEMALITYNKLEKEGQIKDSSYLSYGEVLESNGEYSKASIYYKLYNENHPGHQTSLNHINNYKNISNYRLNKGIIFNQFDLNTHENDFVGFIKDNELIMVSSGFSTSKKKYKWDNQHFLNYYTCITEKNTLKAVPITSQLTSKLHEGPGYYDSFSKVLYFTKNAPMHHSNKDYEVLSNLKIYTSKYSDDRWQKVEELPINHEEFSTGHPTGLPGDNFLIYSSNKPDGYGEADLYIIFRSEQGWSEPKNLGKDINTENQELFPFLLNDSTLYFASNGHNGFGGLDIFKAELKNGAAINVENLGHGFNTPKDDFGIVYINSLANEGYFSSDRTGGTGGADIYTFKNDINSPVLKVINEYGQSLGQKTGEIIIEDSMINFTTNENGVSILPITNKNTLNVKVSAEGYKPFNEKFTLSYSKDTLFVILHALKSHTEIRGIILDEENQAPISNVKVQLDVDTTSYIDTTNNNGEFNFILPKEEKYTITFYKTGYLTTKSSTESDKRNIIISKPLTAINEGMFLNIKNIYYDFNEDYITYQAEPILDSLANIMLVNPSLEIEVSSHTDSRGSLAHNEDLSLRRAKSVIDYLKTKKIKVSRLSLKYYGESKLSNDCGDGVDCDEVYHSSNRRTEFRIIRF